MVFAMKRMKIFKYTSHDGYDGFMEIFYTKLSLIKMNLLIFKANDFLSEIQYDLL